MPALGAAELETVAQGPPGRRWLLLEAPLPGTGTLDGLQDSAQELRDRGFGLLIGHPERSPALVDAPGAVEGLLAAGDRLQVNGSSLTGYHGAARARRGARARRRRPRGRHRLRCAPSLRSRPEPDRGRRRRCAATAPPPQQAEALVAAAPRALLERGIAPRRRLAA